MVPFSIFHIVATLNTSGLVYRLSSKKNSAQIISPITNTRYGPFYKVPDTMTSQLFIKFMGRLIKDTDQKVYLFLENPRSHPSTKVKEGIDNHKSKMMIFYLSLYFLKLNPNEYLNGDLSTQLHKGIPSRSQNDLEHNTR